LSSIVQKRVVTREVASVLDARGKSGRSVHAVSP
jgi:hypothetical protein